MGGKRHQTRVCLIRVDQRKAPVFVKRVAVVEAIKKCSTIRKNTRCCLSHTGSNCNGHEFLAQLIKNVIVMPPVRLFIYQQTLSKVFIFMQLASYVKQHE